MTGTRTGARRRVARIAAAAVALAVVGGCGGGQPTTPAGASAAASAAAEESAEDSTDAARESAEEVRRAEGELAPPGQATNAFTYNPALAPEGAQMEAAVDGQTSGTQVTLEVEGLLPDRGYAAHAHANPCGATGDAAGPHYQNTVDPAAAPGKPSVDPAYANPQNEIWLDLRTDAEGAGQAIAEVPFGFTDRAPASVVLHEAQATATEPGKAGTAGARLGCLDVAFR